MRIILFVSELFLEDNRFRCLPKLMLILLRKKMMSYPQLAKRISKHKMEKNISF